MRKIAEDRVVLQKVCKRLRIGKVVDCDDLNILVVECGAKHVASDAPETVDSYFDSHSASVMSASTQGTSCTDIQTTHASTRRMEGAKRRWQPNSSILEL